MGQILHGCATTTEAVRRAIQNSQESLRGLAKRYGINQKTVAKWKQRETVADLPTGPKRATSTLLSRKRSSSLSGDIRCCRSTIASTHCSRPSHISRGHPCTAASSDTASADCRRSKAVGPRRKGSRLIRLAICTSTSPRSRPPKASSTSMSLSIAPASSRSCNWSGRREGPQPRRSSKL